MTQTLRWGLLSTARINRSIIPPLHASERNKLVAVASRNKAKAEEYAQEWKIPCAHNSYESLLTDPEVDVIYNSLPNSLHAEWTVKALQAGKHVLCEKPLATNIADIDAIITAVERSGKIVSEAFMYRHHPQTLKVKELVDSGALGKLRLIHGVFSFNLASESDVRLDPALGGGSIWDIGCYPISYTRLITGVEPEEVFGWQMCSKSGVDLLFSGQMRFADEVFAQFDCSFCAPYRAQIEIIGSQASLTVPIPFKPGTEAVVYLNRGNDDIEQIVIAGQELYLGEVEDIADAILLDKSPRISLRDSRGNAATILALLESANNGKSVKI